MPTYSLVLTYQVFGLLTLFYIKHLVADFPLQGRWMLGKFKPGWDFVGPLAAHCGIHAAFTFVIAAAYLYHVSAAMMDKPTAAIAVLAGLLAGFDFSSHFVMDRLKASPRLLGRYKNMKKPAFWLVLGIDQTFHHFSDLVVIWVLVTT